MEKIFFPIAFIGVLSGAEVLDQLLFQFILKTVYEIVLVPLTIPFIGFIKRYEGTDTYDEQVSYGIFEVFRHK